jgi:D-alanyl-D-alanine dipeptidase
VVAVRDDEMKAVRRLTNDKTTFTRVRAAALALVSALTLLSTPAPARVATAQDGPPKEAGAFREPDLVELIELDSSIKLDVRYATPNNFAGRAVYKEARAFLQRPAAEALVRASRTLREKGYGLAVFDGYRPWSVTRLFWDITPADKKQFVADPAKGSRHNRGCAVDLTLYDLKTGRQVSMPGEYDEMSERSHVNYAGGTAEQRRLRDLLRAALEAEGFMPYEPEWWHYDYKDWRQYPILNLAFDEIGRPKAKAAGASHTK